MSALRVKISKNNVGPIEVTIDSLPSFLNKGWEEVEVSPVEESIEVSLESKIEIEEEVIKDV
mgnify:CR=1 FL=1|jgi:hypothetical protein